MFKVNLNKLNRGFTLIELLVAIAIIGTLASVVFASLNSGRDKAKVVAAEADVGQIMVAVKLWRDAGSEYPTGATNSLCENTVEYELTEDVDLWNYLSFTQDPWENNYWIDGAYQCDEDTEGCGGISDAQALSAVVLSFGPNGTNDSGGGDDVVYVACKR